ncbi:MAG: type II secretion system F family protein [Actinomycetota bacterium]|nr:type II secretion system F family protein [Actinomycetota bacterium]
MNPDLLLAAGLGGIFMSVVLVLGTIGVITAERDQVSRSLTALRSIEGLPADMRADFDRPFSQRVLTPGRARLVAIGYRLTPAGRIEKLRQRLEAAGSPTGWDVERLLAIKVLSAVVGFLLGMVVVFLLGASSLVGIGSTVALVLLGFFAADLAIYQIAYNRRAQVRKDLPDALDLLTITVEAGLAFDAALTQVSRNTDGPLAEEFTRVLQEMQIGKSRGEALTAVSARVNIPELNSFVTAVMQADALGIPIATVLRIQAKEMRIKRSQRAEESAMKVPVKILFPLIFCIMPALFVVIMGPAGIGIFRSFSRSG